MFHYVSIECLSWCYRFLNCIILFFFTIYWTTLPSLAASNHLSNTVSYFPLHRGQIAVFLRRFYVLILLGITIQSLSCYHKNNTLFTLYFHCFVIFWLHFSSVNNNYILNKNPIETHLILLFTLDSLYTVKNISCYCNKFQVLLFSHIPVSSYYESVE